VKFHWESRNRDRMQGEDTFEQLEGHLKRYDLLCHPFYEAWSAGELTQADLREYAAEYYHHVAAFPTYLSSLHARLPGGPLRRAVLRNLCGEEIDGVPHSELWLDFAEGVGVDREAARLRTPLLAVQELIYTFRTLMESSPASALAACYAYESQVPRIAKEKARTLVAHYGGNPRTCRYFELHRLADQHHARVWKRELNTLLSEDPALGEEVLDGAEEAARALWRALDGIERCRQVRREEDQVKTGKTRSKSAGHGAG
jgi:pyrroloquinoline-quinone synthase